MTANCINFAADILLKDLGLPPYFFAHIQKPALAQLLQSIASNIRVIDGKADLFGRVAHIDFDLSYGSDAQKVRIATEETRDSMENLLENLIAGHRREYYYSPDSSYYTYIIRPETIQDFPSAAYGESRFLFTLAGDYSVTPKPTRKRYEKFFLQSEEAITLLIEVFNLQETGETRLMFQSNFESPQLPILRKILADRGYTLIRAYWEPYLAKNTVSSSLCSIYIREELNCRDEKTLVSDLCSFLSFAISPVKDLYTNDILGFREMLLNLVNKDHQGAFAKRIQESNKSTYGATLIDRTVHKHPDLIKILYQLFEQRFNPDCTSRITTEQLENEWQHFEKKISSRFMDFPLGYDIFCFMFKIASCTLKTNFYHPGKRSYSFRFDN